MATRKKTTKTKIPPKGKIGKVKSGVNKSTKKKNFDTVIHVVPSKTSVQKIYPPIYTYIYEREPEDMAKIYEDHKNVQLVIQNTPKQIAGFKLVNNQLIAIPKSTKKK